MGFIGDIVDGITDIPILGDAVKIGSNFIPGVGPLVGMGINAVDAMHDQRERQNAIEQAMGQTGGQWDFFNRGPGGITGGGQQGFAPGGQTQGGFSPANENYPFLSMGPTEQDVSDQEELLRIAGLFEGLSGDLGAREDQLFDLFTQELDRTQDPSFGSLSADEVADFGGQVGAALGRDLFRGGGSVEQAFNQGIGQQVQSGFGTRSGGLSNALLNATKEANQRISDQAIAASGQFAGPLAQVEAANTAASVNRLGQLGGLFQSFGAERIGALENLFGATANAQELPFGRESQRLGLSGQRQALSQQEAAFPHILKALDAQTPGLGSQILAQALPGLVDMGIGEIFGNVNPETGQREGGIDFGNIFGGLFGGGGGPQFEAVPQLSPTNTPQMAPMPYTPTLPWDDFGFGNT